jgi:hypothetical protein
MVIRTVMPAVQAVLPVIAVMAATRVAANFLMT